MPPPLFGYSVPWNFLRFPFLASCNFQFLVFCIIQFLAYIHPNANREGFPRLFLFLQFPLLLFANLIFFANSASPLMI